MEDTLRYKFDKDLLLNYDHDNPPRHGSCCYAEFVEARDYDKLREQNRVLATHLHNLVEWALEVTKDWTVDDDSTLANDLRMIWQAQAALTATSQPAPPYKEWCRHPEECAGLASCPRNPTCAD